MKSGEFLKVTCSVRRSRFVRCASRKLPNVSTSECCQGHTGYSTWSLFAETHSLYVWCLYAEVIWNLYGSNPGVFITKQTTVIQSNTNRFIFFAIKTNRRTNLQILFWYETLHVSGSFSAHPQGLSTVHSALAHVIQVPVPVPNVQWITPEDGQRNCPKHVEFRTRIKFVN